MRLRRIHDPRIYLQCPHASLPAFPELASADFKRFEREFLAGLTVGLLALPQSVAYAGLAGMPLITGIYATLLPTLIAALFSATPRLAAGPTALTCLLIFGSLSGLAEPGSSEWVMLAGW